MEVKPGYKQTEVGIIPQEWDVVQLGDLKPFVTSGSRGWASYYAERGSLFVRITNLSRESIYLDLTDSKFVELPPEASEGVRTQLRKHDVLISITADIGIVGYVDASVGSPAYINQHIALVRFDASRASGKFVSYFLASEKPQRLFRASTDVGAKAGMSLITVQKIQTALPPLPEQRAIAEALNDVDGLLGGLDRLIAKKRDLKQAAMQQLLTGQTRLPGFHGEWEVNNLKQAAEISTGINKPLSEMGSGALYVTVQDLYDATSIRTERLSRIKVSRAEIEAKALAVGDIVFGKSSVKRDGIAYPSQFLGCQEPVVFSGFTYRARARQGISDAIFLFYALRTAETRRWVIDNAQASALTNINQKIADAIPVQLPPTVAEQTAIAEVLTEIDGELAALEQRLEKTRALKQAMMQELLTGRIRLVGKN